MVLSCVNPLSACSLCCISMNDQACKVRPEIVNVNINEPVFSLDYDAIAVDHILDIHKYLMKKNNII